MKTIADLERLAGILSEIPAVSPANGMPVKVVAIDGHGGSGKSTLANQLAELLHAEIIHTDDFASWDNPYDWWPSLIEKVLDPIKQGAKTLSYERSKWAEDHHPEPINNQQVTPIVILEGVSSARREFRPYLAYSVWVTAPKDICIARGVERDGEKMRQQWEQWWADEEKYIQEHEPQKYVDATVSGIPIPAGAPDTLTYTQKQRIDFLANIIVDRIVEDRKNGWPLLHKIAKENMAKSNIPVYTISLPEYQVDTEPDHKAIGKIVDDEIKKHFLGQTVLIRGVGSMEHPDLSIDDLIALIMQLGSDRYNPQRVGDRYENIDGKKIDLFALRRKITLKSQIFWQLSWSFYKSPLKTRGYPVRVDILTIYDPARLKAVVHQPTNHPQIKRDGFVFRDPDNASAAVKAIFKITS